MKALLENKIALVTGGASGIGRAAALIFAREGAKVVVDDINTEGGEATVKMIEEKGGEAFFFNADVSKAAEVEALVQETVNRYGRLDCAYNNAGVTVQGSKTADGIEEEWEYVINVNLKGVWLCMKYEIPVMLKSGGGAIVNTSSTAGIVGYPDSSIYIASKHGVAGITKCAAIEYAESGIRVNAVCPSATRTAMYERFKASGRITMPNPMNHIGEPEEVAEAVVWLLSDAASMVTGHTMAVDGGYLAR